MCSVDYERLLCSDLIEHTQPPASVEPRLRVAAFVLQRILMRAIAVTRPGRTEPFDLVDVTVPDPGPEEIRIRVRASTINRVDLMILNGFMHSAGFIAKNSVVGVGNDVAGVVDAIGAEVTRFSVGDRVAGEVPAWEPPGAYGAHADYVVMPASAIAEIPAPLDFVHAASIPLNGLTALQALDAIPNSVGPRLLITGAAGAVGGYAVALAARAGLDVTALARAGDEDFVRNSGARELVTSLDDVDGFDAVLDTAGVGLPAVSALRAFGFYSGIGAVADTSVFGDDVTVSDIHTRPNGQQVGELLALAAAGHLETRIAGTVDLADPAIGFAHVRAGASRGRWVIVP